MPIRFPCANPECGFELVISARAEAREVRCPNCGLVQPAPDFGPLAPAPRDAAPQPPRRRTPMPIAGPTPKEHGFLGEGLRSGLYALRALPKMVLLLLCLTAGRFLYDLCFGTLTFLLSLFCFLQVLGPLAAGVAWYAMLGFVLRYFLDVAVGALERVARVPDVPRLGLWDFFEYGVTGLGVLVLYVVPIVTLPLLPLGLLALAYSEDTRPFDVRWAARAAWRFRRQLAGLWALLAFWCVALVAAAKGVSWALGRWIASILGKGDDMGAVLLAATIDVLGSVALALVGCVFLFVLFRCVGLAGRYHPAILQSLPEKPPRTIVLAGMVAGGVAASVLVHYGIYWVLT